jgi:hypothetical protein
MRYKFSTRHPSQTETDSLPRLPLVLRNGEKAVTAIGLVDSGATVNVLPYRLGLQLGFVWQERTATLRLAGNLGEQVAQGVVIMAEVADYTPVRLVFAWIRNDNAPLILGHTNFFMTFDVCFFRSELEFEVKPKLS